MPPPTDLSEPGALITSLFTNLVDKIKSNRPLRSDGRAVTSGFVYSQLVLGMPIDPRDFTNPWSPIGGASLQDAVKTANTAVADPAAAAAAEVKEITRAMRTAYNTSALVDSMIMVSKDDSYQTFPQGRSISFAYNGIINAMQPSAAPEPAEDVKKRVAEARKLLYVIDADGVAGEPTPLFAKYMDRAQAYADAKGAFEDARVAAMATPLTAASWPMRAAPHQQRVDRAYDMLKSSGADKVEAALATLESVGVNIDAAMIANSRKVYDRWSLGLSGVAVPVPYSFVFPSGWCDPDRDVGFQTIEIKKGEYNTSSSSVSNSNYWSNWQSKSRSSGGGGVIGFGPFFGGGSGGSSSSSSSSAAGSGSSGATTFRNDSKNLGIEIEYGLCNVVRPWFLGDLFYLRNWYLHGNKKNAISDGTINDQAGDTNKLLPMVPRQFLVIRKVKITSTQWASDGATFQNLYSQAQSEGRASSGYASGGGGFSLGFITVGGRASSSWSDASGSASGSTSGASGSQFGWKYDHNGLEIKGAQIIAWLSEIVPGCPTTDAPPA